MWLKGSGLFKKVLYAGSGHYVEKIRMNAQSVSAHPYLLGRFFSGKI